MKKFLLLTAACAFSVAAVAQQSVVNTTNVKKIVATAHVNDAMTGEEAPFLPLNASPAKAAATYDNEFEVGHTYFDLQSNSGLSNRFIRHNDGTIGATWTGGMEATAFADRGSFYNYFNGTEWTINPTEVGRVEDIRTGWPSYAADNNGGEYLAFHSAGVGLYHRATKGSGDWTQVAYPVSSADNTWPRMCVNPETGTIHLIEAEQRTVGDVMENYVYYSRSKDGGKTWDPKGEPFAQIDGQYSTIAYAADDYIWATPRNGVIAFALVSTTADLIIMKSTDDGDTWEKMTVWEHPVPMFNYYEQTLEDTLIAPTGAAGLAIDNDGMCHIMFATCATLWAETGGSFNYFPLWGTMCYWNEDMDTYRGSYDVLDMSEDYDTYSAELLCEKPISYGFCFDGDASATAGGGLEVVSYYRTFGPARFISFEPAGPNRIICAVSSWDERRFTPEGFVMTQIYLCSYAYNDENERWELDTNWIVDPNMNGYQCMWTGPDGGIPWDYAGWFRMNNHYLHEYDECVYPQVVTQYSESDDANFYVFYNLDIQAGLALDADTQTEYVDNTVMMYYNDRNFNGGQFPEDPSLDGIADVENEASSMKVYPNPTSDIVNIQIEGAATVNVYNVLGQLVDTFQVNGSDSFSVASYSAGIYFITADNGITSTTQKLIVR